MSRQIPDHLSGLGQPPQQLHHWPWISSIWWRSSDTPQLRRTQRGARIDSASAISGTHPAATKLDSSVEAQHLIHRVRVGLEVVQAHAAVAEKEVDAADVVGSPVVFIARAGPVAVELIAAAHGAGRATKEKRLVVVPVVGLHVRIECLFTDQDRNRSPADELIVRIALGPLSHGGSIAGVVDLTPGPAAREVVAISVLGNRDRGGPVAPRRARVQRLAFSPGALLVHLVLFEIGQDRISPTAGLLRRRESGIADSPLMSGSGEKVVRFGRERHVGG